MDRLKIPFLSRCEDSSCVCEAGWRGPRCGEKDCDARCSFHGQCKNGTCLCVAGWNGLHCTLEGCPNGCSNHGSCKANFRGEWSCHCHPGWEGPDCSVRLETRCNDGYDDDQGNFSLLQGVSKAYSSFLFQFRWFDRLPRSGMLRVICMQIQPIMCHCGAAHWHPVAKAASGLNSLLFPENEIHYWRRILAALCKKYRL